MGGLGCGSCGKGVKPAFSVHQTVDELKIGFIELKAVFPDAVILGQLEGEGIPQKNAVFVDVLEVLMARSTTHMEGLVSQEAGSRERPGRCESDDVQEVLRLCK